MERKAISIKWVLLLLGVVLSHVGTAQQAPQYSQYIFNELVINPAYAGSKEILNINATYRSQWVGLEGAPTTQSLSIDGPTGKANVGWGGHLIHDAIGAQSQTGVYANISVRVSLNATSKLALGVAGGASQYTLDGTMLRSGSNMPDDAIPAGRESKVLPDAKVGLFFNTERYYAGLTAASLIPFKSNNMLIATPRRHYFLSTGYILDLGQKMRLKPSILLKEDFRSPTNIDLNTFLLLHDRFWIGASYRTALPIFTNPAMKQLEKRNAAAFMAQIYATAKLRVGYSYDMTLSKLSDFSSHEVSVGYSFYKREHGRILTPRNL